MNPLPSPNHTSPNHLQNPNHLQTLPTHFQIPQNPQPSQNPQNPQPSQNPYHHQNSQLSQHSQPTSQPSQTSPTRPHLSQTPQNPTLSLSQTLLCPKHSQPITKLCTFHSPSLPLSLSCPNRLLCPDCEYFDHPEHHLTSLESIEDHLKNILSVYIDRILGKADQSLKSKKTHQDIIASIEDSFKSLQNHLLTILNDYKQKAIARIVETAEQIPFTLGDANEMKTHLNDKLQSALKVNFDPSSDSFKGYLSYYLDIKAKLQSCKQVLEREKNKLFVFKVNDIVMKRVKEASKAALEPLGGDVVRLESREINKGFGIVTVGGLCYVNKPEMFMVGDLTGTLNIYDLNTVSLTRSIKCAKGIIKILHVPKHKSVFLGMTDGLLQKVSLEDFKTSPPSKLDLSNVTLTYISDEDRVACSGGIKKIEFMNLGTSLIDYELECEYKVGSTAYLEDKKWLAAGLQSGQVHIYDLESKKLVQKLLGHMADLWIHALSYSGKERTLMTGSGDGTVKIWKLNESGAFENVRGIKKVGSWVDNIIGLYEKDLFVTVNADAFVRSWRISSGELVRQREVVEIKTRCAIWVEERGWVAVADNGTGSVRFVEIGDLM